MGDKTQQKKVLWTAEGTGINQAEEQAWVDSYFGSGKIVEVYSVPTIASVGYGMDEHGRSKGYVEKELELVHYVVRDGRKRIDLIAP